MNAAMKALRIASLGPRPVVPFDLEPSLFDTAVYTIDQMRRTNELRSQYDAVREWDRWYAEICSEHGGTERGA